MKIKTSEATPIQINWLVATCEGFVQDGDPAWEQGYEPFDFCNDWSQGGPIIEREGIRLHRSVTGQWWAGPESEPFRPVVGSTPLIAGMRCFVASRLGDEVDVPDELLA